MKDTKPDKVDYDYFKDIYEIVKLIPLGRVTTYGAIQHCLNLPSPRMVGWAVKQLKGNHNVPAHRLLNSQGVLSGRLGFTHPDMMQELLELEGVVVKNNRVQDFKNIFWDPNTEL
jgi:methylated-DNA-protein-cysteine methyltransferase related protein